MIYHFSSISRERCTFEVEYFVLPYIIAYTSRSHSIVLPYITAYTSCSHSFVLLLDNFIIFLALYVKVALPKNEYLYFLSSSYVLPRVTGRTSLILRKILSFLHSLAGTLHFPNLNLYTSCWHYVHFQNWIFVLPSTRFIIFLALTWKLYFQKLNILYFPILLHILPARIVLYFPLLLHILPARIVLYFLLDDFIIF
jgi:hypothetical protein